MDKYYNKLNEKRSYHRPIFLLTSLLTAGFCSLYPQACFKNYSAKERHKKEQKVKDLEQRQREEEEYNHHPRENVPSSREPSPAGSRRRSRAQPVSSPRTSTSEAVPSQLLGRRSCTDADFLEPTTPDSVKQYRVEQKATATAQLRNVLSPSPTLPFRLSLSAPSTTDQSPFADSPTQTPGSVSSMASTDTFCTISTQSSDASTLAYELRRGRPDMRLLHKKSRPSQHTIQKASILKLPHDIKRSPSSSKARVVADTSVVEATTTGMPEVTVSTTAVALAVPERQDSFIKKPLRKTHTLAVPPLIQRRPQLELQPAEMKAWRDIGRPLFSRASVPRSILPMVSSPTFPLPLELPTRQLRFESPLVSEPHTPDLSVAQPSRKPSLSHGRPKGKRHYHSVTPPEEEPRETTLPHHGDSYFQTFHVEAVPSRDFIPLRTPQPILERREIVKEKPWSEADPPLSTIDMTAPVLLTGDGDKTPVRPERPRLTSDRRKRSSMFSFFRKTAFNDRVFEEDLEAAKKAEEILNIPKASTAAPVTTAAMPGITLSTFEDGASKRRLSSVVPEMQMQSYFSRPRVRHQQSDSTLSPSGLATPVQSGSEEASPSSPHRIRPRHQHRSSSEHLSPTATPIGRPRARHRPTQESLRGELRSVDTLPRSTTIDTQLGIRSRGTKTAMLSGGRRSSLKFADPVRAESPGPKTRLSAIRKRSSVVLSNLFADLRKVSSAEQLLHRVQAYEHGSERRESLTARLSTVIPKMSMESIRVSIAGGRRLRRRCSRHSQQMRSTESEEPQPRSKSPSRGGIQPTNVPPDRRFSADDLKVTHFEQTPFSQRYHDSKRAAQQHIRAIIDEGLNEEGDGQEDDELVLGFEQDVPDHLPSSPLCPLHPKHKSGGKAICPQHGRYKRDKTRVAVRPLARRTLSRNVSSATAFTGGHRMEIVFDTREEAKVRASSLTTVGLERTSEHLRARALSLAAALEKSLDNRATNDVKARTASMGSDGAGPSPASSAELRAIRAATAAAGTERQTIEVGRGRTRVKDACGSNRLRRRRVRMRRSR
ncbi:unnamed protein product [Zymoseptoria tritici ST99CH_1E4]|uniref:Uncharacterized protein n=1 Tax=Zymoseptoria tritici ST99CH_1E4 TaxID=1276532 RepID=A0A2H1GHR6_ZYMTR|nr:unnamed protein product [Zymoseptoria tritici ST99CH_1E4]